MHWHTPLWVLSSTCLLVISTEFLARACCSFNLPENWSPLGKSDVALVTGGLNGLGLEIVQRLSKSVGKVIVYDVQEPRTSLGANVEFVSCNIGLETELETQIEKTISDLASQNMRISVLVNNAGVRYNGSLLNMEMPEIKTLFSVNVFALITLLRSVLRNHMDHHQNERLLVATISSVLGAFGPKNLLIYSATKAAATQIHECLVEELRPYKHIRTLLVMPGQLTTDMFRDVSPSRTFFAPIVDHTVLADTIVDRINKGEAGVLCMPLYTNFLSALKVLPSLMQHWCRKFLRMDEKIPEK